MKKKYDWKKTLLKATISFAEVVLASLVIYFTDSNLGLLLIPVIEAVRNYLKNKDN